MRNYVKFGPVVQEMRFKDITKHSQTSDSGGDVV